MQVDEVEAKVREVFHLQEVRRDQDRDDARRVEGGRRVRLVRVRVGVGVRVQVRVRVGVRVRLRVRVRVRVRDS